MRSLALLLLSLMTQAQPAPAPSPSPDAWAPVRFLAGEWVGESEGEPGKGTVKRSYQFVLGGRFLHERNVSTYPPQPKNPKGEVHEHWSFISHDKARRTLVHLALGVLADRSRQRMELAELRQFVFQLFALRSREHRVTRRV